MAQIPQGADQTVQFILMQVRGTTAQRQLEVHAGLGWDTIRAWHYRPHHWGPRVNLVRRVLNAMGYDLAVVPLEPRR